MNLFSIEEFTSKRRGAQTRIEEALHDTVAEAVDLGTDTSGWDELLDAVEEQYQIAYSEDAEGTAPALPQGWRTELRETLRETTSPRTDRTVNNISIWLATWVLSQATIAATNTDEEDLLLEWVDMGDSNVRPSHRAVSGQQRPPGEPFDVDGVAMPYPGWPGAPIELWINCRCTLRPVLADGFQGKTARMGHTEASATGGVTMTDQIPEVSAEEVDTPLEDVQLMWHGVLAPEGARSGDGRRFSEGGMISRPLPLPLTWQRVSADGHDGSVTVAKIDRAVRVGNEIRGMGPFISNTEAGEVSGMIAEFGRFGVSVDADDVSFELSDDEETVDFTKSRLCSASIVSIPAFAEAWVALGPPPDDFFDGGEDLAFEGPPADEALVASHSFVDVAPGKTEDGPGWLTHPVDTDRLRDYWVRGEGAAKIDWGTPGDFNRCRLALAEYIKPQYLAGYCANRHYDALGFWPGRPVAGDTTPFAERDGDAAPAMSMVASTGGDVAPHEWFENPNFTEKTHLTVTKDGEVYGHIATWDTCHGKWSDECVLPPRSQTEYAYFATGQVLTDKGMVNTGPITIGGTHAAGPKRLRPAMAHYENTCAAVADVAIGDDNIGIWVHGWVRPGTTPQQIATLRASDVSGDWRWAEHSKSMELIAALGVNSGGFHTPRAKVAAAFEGGKQISLVAAGYLPGGEEEPPDISNFAEQIAEYVAKELTARTERKARMDELAASLQED